MSLLKMERNVFTRAVELIEQLRSEEGIILTKPFLELCRQLLPLTDNFGSSMSSIKEDIASNITKLESKYNSDPATYNNLYAMTREEVETKTARSATSCTNAFVWLNRTMDFMVQFFNNYLEHPQWTMTHACTDSYKKTLKKWHGWVTISTFKVVVKLVPERKKFMESIGANSNPNVHADILNLCRTFAPILEDNHKFLTGAGVDDLKAP